jgi:hypothetical protein
MEEQLYIFTVENQPGIEWCVPGNDRWQRFLDTTRAKIASFRCEPLDETKPLAWYYVASGMEWMIILPIYSARVFFRDNKRTRILAARLPHGFGVEVLGQPTDASRVEWPVSGLDAPHSLDGDGGWPHQAGVRGA